MRSGSQKLADPALYQESPEKIAELKQEAELLEQKLEIAFNRWEQLESLKNNN